MRFYVYKLIDPRDGSAFYIGKGCGKRIERHESATRRGTEKNIAKARVIREIWAAGLNIQRAIVARFENEAEAFEFEMALIRNEQPRTNIVGGNCRIYTFFGLLRDALISKIDVRERMARLFPRSSLPTEEHKQLYDAIMAAGARA